MLDLKLTQLALKYKNLVLLDFSFQKGLFPEFHGLYEPRYLSLPCRTGLAAEMAAGLSSFGKLVLVYGVPSFINVEPTANVKWIQHSSEGSWAALEEGLTQFGPQVLLIP